MPRPQSIEVRGARVHNLRGVDVDIPLDQLVAVAGVSGSGKSSLALGVLYAEGSRRYLEALSTYTRRRLTQSGRATVDSVQYVPPALALRQRPAVAGPRSTFGTASELLNSLRLMFSRLGRHRCPNGHLLPPSMDVALDRPSTCPECGAVFGPQSAESYAFNSEGACPKCQGLGTVMEIDDASLVPDENLSIEQGAVLPWRLFGQIAMPKVAEELGVRINVPFKELTQEERDIVMAGPETTRHITWHSKTAKVFELNCVYLNAHRVVEDAVKRSVTDKGLDRVRKFMREGVCGECGGTRLNATARGTVLAGKTLDQATDMTLEQLIVWVPTVVEGLPEAMLPMAQMLVDNFLEGADMLLRLGVGYLALSRSTSTLSTGERQRVQLARAVRAQTTGALYVLDEPSIGLHPSNVDGLLNVVNGLIANGNSVVMVDHDVRALRAASHIVEMGPGAGRQGGQVIAQGSVGDLEANPESLIGPYLSGVKTVCVHRRALPEKVFDKGAITLRTRQLHTVKPLEVRFPLGRMTVVTGVSGSGKTTMVLESLVPALQATLAGRRLPDHVVSIEGGGIERVLLIDATPIGANVRSTLATYCGLLDDLRKLYAALPEANGRNVADFSYNTGALRCPACDGTGQITLDVQFLPDVDVPCPECGGARYGKEAYNIKYRSTAEPDGISLPELLGLTVEEARRVLTVKAVADKLQTLSDLGLGYLTLGEATPTLSGGEAQRLKLATELKKEQSHALYVFDEPTIGLHPDDVATLLSVFDGLVKRGATLIVIEHDLDVVRNADWVVDMGPGGGAEGGRVVVAGSVGEVSKCERSRTGRYL